MDLSYLDKKVPSHWILLLHYWLPFFKTPRNFYFEFRSFIDHLKHLHYNSFPWKKFPDLLEILEKNALDFTEKKLAQEIIKLIFIRESKKITLKLLIEIFEKFNPDIKNTLIVNEALQRIPTYVYTRYINTLNTTKGSSLNLKWCVRLKNKFSLTDRLALILSLSDERLKDNHSSILQLAIQECEDRLLTHNFSCTEFLNANIIQGLLNFIFTRNHNLIFSTRFMQVLINQLLETQNPVLTSHILELDTPEKYLFFENFLATNQNFEQNSQYFLTLCQNDDWPTMVDYLIEKVFSAQETNYDVSLKEEKILSVANWNLLLLTQLQETNYPTNLFQYLAIHCLTKKQFDLEPLKKVFEANESSLQPCKNFSLACQFFLIEKSILAIKIYIKDNFMNHVRKENTRHDIHRAFFKFFNNEYTGKPLDVSKLILKKLPDDLQVSGEADLNFLQQLLTQFYLIKETPAIVAFTNRRRLDWNQRQRAYEERNEAHRELQQRIYEGLQSSVSYQRMEELFGAEAPTQQEKWKKTLGVHFFDATNKEECKVALQEAATIIKFNRDCNDLSCLSTSPSTSNYFM